MPIVSYREYARMKNVNLNAIQKRIKTGTISPDAILLPETERNPGKHPKIDSEIADRDFQMNGDHSRKEIADMFSKRKSKPIEPVPEIKEEIKKPDPPPISEVKPDPKPIKAEVVKENINGQEVKVEKEPYRGESEGARYMGAKATTEELRSRKIYLEVMELEGRLIDKDEVREALETVIQETRSGILNVADKVALQVLGKKDLLEVKTILKTAINDALTELQKLNDDF